MEKNGEVKLLEVKSTNPKENKAQRDKEIQEMIKQKLTLFEGANENVGGSNDLSELNPTLNEDKLQQQLVKIFKNGELDNKEKIQQMTDLFHNEIIPQYEKLAHQLSKESNDCCVMEFTSEYNVERAKSAEVMQQKFKVLSKEYQQQSKNFSQKHQEIRDAEQSKLSGIEVNFRKHFEGVREQMRMEDKSQQSDDGKLLITKENEDLAQKY